MVTVRAIFGADTLARKTEWAAGGGTHVVLIAYWDRLQNTAAGALDSTQLAALIQEFVDAQSVGLRVLLRFGLQYPGSHVTSGGAPVPQFKDQYGVTWSASGPSGENVRDWFSSSIGRTYVGDFIDKVMAGISAYTGLIDQVHIGGGPKGELQYPNVGGTPAGATSPPYSDTYQAWVYSTPFTTGTGAYAGAVTFPDVGLSSSYVPYISTADATSDALFEQIVIGTLIDFADWQIARVRAAGYTGEFRLLLPSFGRRSNTTRTDRAYQEATLQGQVWETIVGHYSADASVQCWSTWIDSPDFWTPPGVDSDKSPYRKLRDVCIAAGKSAPMGENTGAWSYSGTPSASFTFTSTAGAVKLGADGVALLDWSLSETGGNVTRAQFLSLANPPAVVVSDKLFGVNVAGGEFGDSNLPGTLNGDYTYPYGTSTSQYAYFASKGQRLIRLPIRWERVQPAFLGALSTNDIAAIRQALDAAYAAGCRVIIDLHNYARYYPTGPGGGNGGTVGRLTTADAAKLTDLWTKLVGALKDHPAIWAWELMNEPNGLAAEAGTFSGSVRYAWATTIQGWVGGDANHTLTYDGAEGHTATGALKVVKLNSGTTNMNIRVDDAGQKLGSASGNVFSVWIKLAAGTTGAWSARVEWQNGTFTWQANGVTTYYNTSGTLISGLVAGSWVEVRTDFTGNPPTSPNAFLVHVESNNPPASNITIWIDDFAQGTSAGGYTERGVWGYLAAQADAAVATADPTRYRIVPGYVWQHANDWTANNPDFPLTPKDPLRLYGAHSYWDASQGGTYNSSYDVEGGTATKGSDDVAEFLGWLDEHDEYGAITEFGVPDNDARWLTTLDDFLDTLAAHPRIRGVTYWAAGPWWGSYKLSVEPTGAPGAYVDQEQMPVLAAHPSGSTPATPRVVPQTALISLAFARTVPQTARIALTSGARTVPQSVRVSATTDRRIPQLAYIDAPSGDVPVIDPGSVLTAPFVPSARWLVFAEDGTALGEWPLTRLPAYRAGVDGIDTLTVSIPHAAAQPDREGLYAHGNRLEVWVTSEQSLAERTPPATVGEWIIGVSPIGAFAGYSTLRWTGTVEDSSATATALELTCLSNSRLPAQTTIDAYSGSGDPLALARDVTAQYLPGLVWDSRNPATSGETATVAFVTDTAAGILDKLRELCGPGWLWYVTPRGTVRLFEPDATTADHVLSVGRTAVDVQIQRAGAGRRREIKVAWGGGVAVARTPDYRAADPRSEWVQATHLTDAGDAARLALLTLQDRQRTTYRGTVTVPRGTYDLESIEIGDTAIVQHDSQVDEGEIWIVGLSRVGYMAIATPPGGYSTPLVIQGVSYDEAGNATLELGEPVRTATRTIAALMRQTAGLARQTG